ncbi:MAG: hypothetical protein DHS20C17_19960 [Cyclobacteriaceae bacterium]|nr:MAG: hypothetical protein DHS20C17_19960 [Cyclobacteriaceae bacterium]
MKYLIIFTLLITFCGLGMFGQCHTEGSDVQCVEKITSANTFVKSYKLDAERTGDIEYSSVLVKDLRYYLNLCEEGEVSNSVEINVYDSARKLVTSNKSSSQSLVPELSFTCAKTGIYYFVFKKGVATAHCGIGALSFSK